MALAFDAVVEAAVVAVPPTLVRLCDVVGESGASPPTGTVKRDLRACGASMIPWTKIQGRLESPKVTKSDQSRRKWTKENEGHIKELEQGHPSYLGPAIKIKACMRAFQSIQIRIKMKSRCRIFWIFWTLQVPFCDVWQGIPDCRCHSHPSR
jgi:hypothetical protein